MCESVLCQAWIDGVAASPSKTGASMLDAAGKHRGIYAFFESAVAKRLYSQAGGTGDSHRF